MIWFVDFQSCDSSFIPAELVEVHPDEILGARPQVLDWLDSSGFPFWVHQPPFSDSLVKGAFPFIGPPPSLWLCWFFSPLFGDPGAPVQCRSQAGGLAVHFAAVERGGPGARCASAKRRGENYPGPGVLGQLFPF